MLKSASQYYLHQGIKILQQKNQKTKNTITQTMLWINKTFQDWFIYCGVRAFEKSKKEGGSQDFIAKIRGIVHIGGGVYRIVSYIKKNV